MNLTTQTFTKYKGIRNALSLSLALGLASAAHAAITLQPIGTYATGIFDDGGAEIVAHDPGTQRVYSINAASATVSVLDIQDPTQPTLIGEIDVTAVVPRSGGIQSVAVSGGIIAVAVRADNHTLPGSVAFFDSNLEFVNRLKVGALPDMLGFSPDGHWLLAANEGEPSDDYKQDPRGSVSVIDMTAGAANLTDADVRNVLFDAFNSGEALDPGIRIYGPKATVAKDLEPEYIAISSDSSTAWVTLQENNALAIVDIASATVTSLVGLGFKDHSLEGNGLDGSDRDDAVNIANWPVFGMYQPDAIAAYNAGGQTFLVMANEGDARDYDGFSEEVRLEDLDLDPTVFPDAESLQERANLGRLRVTDAMGDIDGDGDFDQVFCYGARSFSIRSAAGELVFDSGDDFEQITSMMFPLNFNASSSNNDFDNRSDDKGPEPEGVALGEVDGRTYAFIGLERIGGIMIYDVTDPHDVTLSDYVNNRDFSVDPEDPMGADPLDLGPEGLAFISAANSPNGSPLLVVGNEISGTTTIFQVAPQE